MTISEICVGPCRRRNQINSQRQSWYFGTLLSISHKRRGSKDPRDDSGRIARDVTTKTRPVTKIVDPVLVERVQTGVRLEKRLLKVLKALADYHDITLGDLLEGIVLHAFEGQTPFQKESLAKIEELKRVFGLTLEARHAHRLKENVRRRA